VFVTLVYGVLDTDSRVFTYANAGHEHPIHYSAQGKTATALDVTGRALALMQGSSYATRAVRLASGDSLVLYTDGITDAGRGIDRFGRERLLSVVDAHAGGDCQDLADALLDSALGFAGGRLVDDAALVVIKAVEEDAD
jgi:sigma-B regulation protein RsbU (phosphoserine phosphatase)